MSYVVADKERRQLMSKLFEVARQHFGMPKSGKTKVQQIQILLKLFELDPKLRLAAKKVGRADASLSSDSEDGEEGLPRDMEQLESALAHKEQVELDEGLSTKAGPQGKDMQAHAEEAARHLPSEPITILAVVQVDCREPLERMARGHFEQQVQEAEKMSAAEAYFDGFINVPRRRGAGTRRKRPALQPAGSTPEKGQPEAPLADG